MTSSERYYSDLLRYTLFQSKIIFVIYKNQFLVEKWKILGLFFTDSSEILSKFINFLYSDDCIGKITSKSNTVFILKKCVKLIKKIDIF